jgi:HEAT repeat protein
MDARRADRWVSMFIACSVLCLTEAARADEESTEALYARWAAQYDGKSEYPKSDQTAPLFLELLGRKDVDTFFIRGTRAKSPPVRWLSWFALGQLKTDQWFDALTQLAHHSSQSHRLSAVFALAEFREPRCISILLEILQKDNEDTVRRETAGVLRLFPDEKVTTALLETLKNDPPAAG